ncbi:tetratricopeptide repeat protein [Streptomyces canus]|uniref:tetratricopeptide repeat protein n=1 Tax=Streptomyces canus TaxID=58343 RepID=UPI0027D804CB|nr:tetratricopeptide repeat protein [Streptomyces canus]
MLIEVAADGLVTVQEWPSGEQHPTRVAPPTPLIWPLDADDLEELRWYLEHYLTTPFGVYSDRGSRVQDRLPTWGTAIFESVFGSGPPRDAYLRARSRGGLLEIAIVSPAAEPLALPWELMADPARPAPIALDQVAISRTLTTARMRHVSMVPGSRLRVLMVISRPRGTKDVAYRMIARPLLRCLENIDGQVDLAVLRPPTLQRLEEVLAEAQAEGQPFQIVHFDGHGSFGPVPHAAGAGGTSPAAGPEPQGTLAFEHAAGSRHQVPAAHIARVLTHAKVPVVVLNACHSAAIGSHVEAAVATRLLQEGTTAVVAMAYQVYVRAAAEFMTAFYEHLFTGGRVAEAVAAGRARLASDNGRPSPKGSLPLADWMVPVLYARGEVCFPQLRARPRGGGSSQHGAQAAEPTDDSLTADGEFVGRDTLFHTLESVIRRQRVAVLHGPAGTGKSELVKAFGRWCRDTGAVDDPSSVIWHSFEPGVATFGLDGVINAVGQRLPGGDYFTQLDDAGRRMHVEEALRTRRMLLIWDNVETVHSMPDPAQATPPLTQPERDELREFLHRVAAGGRSAVILTSRTHETWLGDVCRIAVSSLETEETHQYADLLLAPFAHARQRRQSPAFGELLQWLDGHPLSMRLILPHLNTTEPAELLAALQGNAALPEPEDDGRTTSLAASIAYSFTHLSADDQRTLTVLTLFRGIADSDLLAAFSQAPHCPELFRGRTAQAWDELLGRATQVGLLTRTGDDLYRIHPALPAHLAAQTSPQAPANAPGWGSSAGPAFLSACVTFGAWLSQQLESADASRALRLLRHHVRTMSTAFGHALDHGQWQEAQLVAQPLNEYWQRNGLAEETRAWADRVRRLVSGPQGGPPDLDTPAGALWLFMTGAVAHDQIRARRLDEARSGFGDILKALEQLPTPPDSRHADCHSELGGVALLQGQLDEADKHYEKALEIQQRIGDQQASAQIHHDRGIVAQQRDWLDAAEEHYRLAHSIYEKLGVWVGIARVQARLSTIAQRRSLWKEAEDLLDEAIDIEEKFGDKGRRASLTVQRGTLALEQGLLDEAERWYHDALQTAEDLADQAGKATVYHQLGLVSQKREQWADAEAWYLLSAKISEALEDGPRLARTYHQLCIVTGLQKRLDDAEQWIERSREIAEKLRDRPGMSAAYHTLGLITWEQKRIQESLQWTVACVALCLSDGNPHLVTRGGPVHLRRLTEALGVTAVEEAWRSITGHRLPPDVLRCLLEPLPPEEDRP